MAMPLPSACTTQGIIEAIDMLPSVVVPLPEPLKTGKFYYEVDVLEVGGKGRGQTDNSRNPASEGGQLTIGWATSKFVGEYYNFQG
eukprot:scaffold5011_cov255-Pinguiococcus_pyrenoidosus.AAC.7